MKFDPKKDFDAVQSILDSIPMGVYVLNRERKIQWANARIRNRVQRENGIDLKEGYCYREIFKRERPCADCPALKTLKTGRMEHKEIKSAYRGELGHYSVNAMPLKKGRKEDETLVIETIQDVTVQKKAEEELRRVNDFNTAIINNAPVAIFTIDRTGKFMSVNPALATLSGLEAEAEQKLVGFNWLQNPYTVQCGLAGHIKRGLDGEPFELQDFPFKTYRGDKGQYLHFRGVPLRGKDGNVEGLLCIIEDNTEKVKAQIQSIQDAKTSVIGRLMTGVAHELNNPLATIAANSELACELFQGFNGKNANEEEMTELREYLEVIQEQAFRCKNIINDMIGLTKKKGFEVQEIDLGACLMNLLKLINFNKLSICVTEDIPQNLPHIKGDLNAVKQSLMNILQNAVDAVEGREGGTIRLKAWADDGFVKAEVEDNGGGIHESLVDKIFEPFFSTKGTGKGVGLGLTLCYEFLNRMGGNIEVESTMGKGSLFRVSLPVYMKKQGGRTV
jgi:PAS domain S-box-containing protein